MSHAPSPALERRHQHHSERSRRASLDALVVTSLPNILYLTNFTGSSAIVVAHRRSPPLHHRLPLRRRRSPPRAARRSECPSLELVDGRRLVRRDARAALLAVVPRRRVGFEAAHLTVARHRLAHGDARPRRHRRSRTLVATERIVERARVRKDAYEIDTLREAARRLSAVAAGVLDRGAARDGPSARWRWRSTGASGRPGSSGRRSIRLSPAGRTPRCRTRGPASED